MPIPTYDDLTITRTPDGVTISAPPTHIGIAAPVLACIDPEIISVDGDGQLVIHATDRQVTYRPVAFEHHHGHGVVIVICERGDLSCARCAAHAEFVVTGGGPANEPDPDCPVHGPELTPSVREPGWSAEVVHEATCCPHPEPVRHPGRHADCPLCSPAEAQHGEDRP